MYLEKKKYEFDDKTCRKICILQLVVFAVILLIIVFGIKPYCSGDGGEYMLQTEALYNHHSMDIRDIDLQTSVINFNTKVAADIWNQVGGRYISLNGESYSPHFGGYALFVLPFKLVLKLVGINQFRCFQFANSAFYFLALIVVFSKLKATWKNKMFLLLLLICNPALYYITWTHTEVFSYSFVVLGLVYFYNKNYKLSALFTSIAAMQNPALIFLGAIVGIDYLVNIINSEKEKNENNIGVFNLVWMAIKHNCFNILLMGICYIPFFIPLIHTYINFHKINLVASVARQSEYALEKTMGYLFDLNLGILPYTPIVLILFIVSLIKGLKKDRRKAILHLIALIGIFYIISNQIQINSGMSGIMRYNVWIIPIMIFYIVLSKEVLYRSNKINKLFPISAIITLGVIFFSGGIFCNKFTCLEFSPWTKFIMEYIPNIYNPYHGIFISRATHKEGYTTEEPVIYTDDNGFVRKILISPGTKEKLNLIPSFGEEKDIEYLDDKIKNLDSHKEYQYINIGYEHNIKMTKVIDVFEPSSLVGQKSELPGIYPSEGEFCWIGPKASIAISNKKIGQNDIELTFVASDLLKKYNPNVKLKMDIYINNKLFKSIELEENDLNKDLHIVFENEKLPEAYKNAYTFDFVTNATFNPKIKGLSEDSRDLSILLKYLGPKK